MGDSEGEQAFLSSCVNNVMFREADVTGDPKEGYSDGGGR